MLRSWQRAPRHPVSHKAPVTIVVGEEEFLIDRAVRDLITARRGRGAGRGRP